jgi:hypothetical protein
MCSHELHDAGYGMNDVRACVCVCLCVSVSVCACLCVFGWLWMCLCLACQWRTVPEFRFQLRLQNIVWYEEKGDEAGDEEEEGEDEEEEEDEVKFPLGVRAKFIDMDRGSRKFQHHACHHACW